MKEEKQALTLLVEETAQTFEHGIVSKLDLIHEYEGKNLWVVGDLGAVQKNLAKLINSMASKTMDHMGEITVKTGIMSSGLKCLAACRAQLNLGEGNYAFLEVESSPGEMSHASRPKIFHPFIRLNGFDGYCLADPVIQGVQESYHGVLHVVTSSSGENTLSRILIPIKQRIEKNSPVVSAN